MKLTVDRERAAQVVLRLQDAFTHREGLLEVLDDLVENQIPNGVEPLSRSHALFLFYIVSNDHGVKSSNLYSRAKGLFQARPELFEPTTILEVFSGPDDPNLVESTGLALGTRYPKETAKSWYLNSIRLQELFAGDPRNLFCSSNDASKLYREIAAFRGYGPKTGGMLLRAIVGLEFVRVVGLENVLIPVDIHDSRISFFTEIVHANSGENDTEPNYYSYVRDIQRVLLDACNVSGLSWIDVDRALWLIGSRGCVKQQCLLCPLKNLCKVGQEVIKKKLTASTGQHMLFEMDY